MVSVPGSGRPPGKGNDNPLQYSCLENPGNWGTWWSTVHGSQGVGHDWATDQQACQRLCTGQCYNLSKWMIGKCACSLCRGWAGGEAQGICDFPPHCPADPVALFELLLITSFCPFLALSLGHLCLTLTGSTPRVLVLLPGTRAGGGGLWVSIPLKSHLLHSHPLLVQEAPVLSFSEFTLVFHLLVILP